MSRGKSNRLDNLKTRLATVVLVLPLVSMLGCVAAVPVAVYYMATERAFTMTMEVNAPAQEAFDAFYKISTEGVIVKSPLEIIQHNKEELFFEGTKVGEKGEELWAAWKVTPISRKKSNVILSAWFEDWPMEEVKQAVRNNVRRVCDLLGYKCKVVHTGEEREMI